MTEISIFPIPGCVTFPGTVFPLHVFEPRYRDMINHCLEQNSPVAICHTQSVISPGRPADNMREALSSNQATYRPYDVFSAGYCELIETTADGRMYLNIHICERYRRGEEIQQLPYPIYACEVFSDQLPTVQERRENQQLKEKIIHRLSAIAMADKELDNRIPQLLATAEWQQMMAEDFSFRLFGLIRFDADILQNCLEMDSAGERLNFVLALLNADAG